MAARGKGSKERGAELFTEFLESNGITDTLAAEQLRVTRPAVHWWRTGTWRPTAGVRELIEKWTRGKVPADAWGETPDRRTTKPKTVRPFEPASVTSPRSS